METAEAAVVVDPVMKLVGALLGMGALEEMVIPNSTLNLMSPLGMVVPAGREAEAAAELAREILTMGV